MSEASGEPLEAAAQAIEEENLEDDEVDAPAVNKKQLEDSSDEERGEGEEEGEEEAEAGSVDSSEEEEEDGENEYEADGFVVDEDDEEGGEGGEDEEDEARRKRKKKKKRKREKDFALDEEDYDLLEDNQVQVKRPSERKRLKKRGGSGREDRAMGAQQLEERLFGQAAELEDELADLADDEVRRAREEERRPAADDGFDVSDEMDDFIDDGDGGKARRRARARTHAVAARSGVDPAALEQAVRVFGDVSDLMDLHESRIAMREAGGDTGLLDWEGGSEEGGSEEGLEGEELEDLDGLALSEEDAARKAAARAQARKQARRRQKLEKLLQHIGREEAAARYLLPEDMDIRDTDLPERLQLERHWVDMGALSQAERDAWLDEAAAWVHSQLFGAGSNPNRVRDIVATQVFEVTGLAPRVTREAAEALGEAAWVWPGHLIQGADPGGINLRRCKALTHSVDSVSDREAWVLQQARSGPAAEALRANVRAVLERLFVAGEEVPVVGMFRADQAGDLMALRLEDCPEVTGGDGRGADLPRWPLGSIQPKHRRIRRWDVLWGVYAAGLRFCELWTKRRARYAALNTQLDELSARPAEEGDPDKEERDADIDLLAECARSVEAADSLAGVEDAELKAKALLGTAAQAQGDAGGQRRPSRPSKAQLLRSTGLSKLLPEVQLSTPDLVENVEADSMVNEPPEPSERPLDWADARVRAGVVGAVADGAQLLERLQDLLAELLAVEPVLKRGLRTLYRECARISTRPTSVGSGVLDPFHPYARAKRLNKKPLTSFAGSDTWLRVVAAQQDKLITVEWEVEGLEDNLLAPVFRVWGDTSGVSEAAQGWREVRRTALRQAITQRLLPLFQREAAAQLTAEASAVVLDATGDRLWDFLRRPPLRLMLPVDFEGGGDEREEAVLSAPRVMAVAWGSNNPPEGPTALVQLDEAGNLKDLARLPQLSGRIPRTVNTGAGLADYNPCTDAKKSKDAHLVKAKVLEGLPHALLVGTGHPHAAQLKDDLGRVILHIDQDKEHVGWRQALETRAVDVTWADDSLAGLWANSEAARREFADQPALVRKAIALGRLALEPLAVVASLASGPGCELASLRLHEVQDRVPREALAARLTQLLVTAVAQVGVDINAAIAQPWRQPLLAYVPGLGPRKAALLLRFLSAGTPLFSRLDLKAPAPGEPARRRTQVLGPLVFSNAAAAIRVRPSSEATANGDFVPQDDMRVHPEAEVALTQWLAPELREAAGLDPVSQSDEPDLAALVEGPGGRAAVEQQYDPWSFTSAHGLQDRLLSWHEVGAELMAPYAELRPSCDAALYTPENVFYLLHGEPRDGRLEGRRVEARVHWVGVAEAKCYVEPGAMEVLLLPGDVSSTNTDRVRLSEYLSAGQVVSARIAGLGPSYDRRHDGLGYGDDKPEEQKWPVYITTSSDKLQDNSWWEGRYCKQVEPYYQPDAEAAAAAAAAGRGPGRERAGQPELMARLVDHPLYAHVKMEEAQQRLQADPPGTPLFRPSQRSNPVEALQSISLTFKLADTPSGPLWVHTELREAPKARGDRRLKLPVAISYPGAPGSAQGKEGEVAYDDLDEVVARFVDVVVERARELQGHRKFAQGDRPAVEAAIHAEQAALRNPNAPAYKVAFDHGRPFQGYVGFVTRAGKPVAREPFRITPEGFWFRYKVHRDVEHMLNTFKADPTFMGRGAAAGAGGGYQMGPSSGAAPGGAAAGGLGYGGAYRQPGAPPAPAAAAGGYAPMAPGAPYGGGYPGYGGPPPAAPAAAAAGGMMGGYYPGAMPGYPPQQQQQPPPYQQPPAAGGYGGYYPGAPGGPGSGSYSNGGQQVGPPQPLGNPAGGYPPGPPRPGGYMG